MNPNPTEAAARAFEVVRQEAARRRQAALDDPRPAIRVCTATCGIASGALETKAAFEEALVEFGVEARVFTSGCLGHCYAEPLVVIENPGFPPILYHQVTPGLARMLVRYFLLKGDPSFEHVLGAIEENDMIPTVMDFPRFNREKRVILEQCGTIDPEDVYDYVAAGGYAAFASALQRPPEDVLQEVIDSGLRGRGGAGFPTGRKWELARNAAGSDRIVICNADEGDPGAYMDRTVLESNPHLVLEGMAICAYAVGAGRGLVYVRAEYPLAVNMVARAVQQAREIGILGRDVLGSGFDLDMDIYQGSGAFVCGEESALIRSIEGRRGTPRLRPPYPAEKGYLGRPTVINNVKTLATIPAVVGRGAKWFRGIGTDNNPGTAVFSVVGDVVQAGLVEIPMGTTLRTLIFDVCGGIPNKKKFKAVQIGGPSGGCLPEEFLDLPIDFDSLTGAGAMMGSGGIVVMNEDACMVDIARYFLDFTQKESCGKCTFCRIGTHHLLEILDRLTRGEGREGDLETLDTLSRDVKNGSLCGLGQTAPNPVITSLRYFFDEYRAHLEEKRCPAGSCRALTAFYIDLDKCARGCDACVGSCPVEAIFTTASRKKSVDQDLCVKCGECVVHCPPEYDAILKVSPPHLAPRMERPPEADAAGSEE